MIVPVLSKTTVLIPLTASRASPFLIRTPSLAARPVPTIRAVGVASPNAHGQAITITATAKSIAETALAFNQLNQTTKVTIAMIKTAGTKTWAIRSVNFWIGAWLVWAFLTSSTIWESIVSAPTFWASNWKVPAWLIVEPITGSPTPF